MRGSFQIIVSLKTPEFLICVIYLWFCLKDKRNVQDDFSRVILPVKAVPVSGRYRHTRPPTQVPMLESSMGFGFFVLFCFSLDTNFLTMYPLKPVAQNGFRGASDAPRKGGRPPPLRRNSGTQPLRPREHTARRKSAGGSDRPRIRQAPTPPRPTPTVPAPHTGLHAAPQPSPAQPSTGPPVRRREPSEHAGGRRRRRLAGWPPPYLSCQGLRARLRPHHRRPTPESLPVAPRPPRPRGLPDAPPDPLRPAPHPLAPEAQGRSSSRKHATLPGRPAGVENCALSAAEETSVRHKAGHLERDVRVRTVPGKPVRTTRERRL